MPTTVPPVPAPPVPPAPVNVPDPAATAAPVVPGVTVNTAKKDNRPALVGLVVLAALIGDLMNVKLVTSLIGGFTESVGQAILSRIEITTPHQVGSLVILAMIAGALVLYLAPIALRQMKK